MAYVESKLARTWSNLSHYVHSQEEERDEGRAQRIKDKCEDQSLGDGTLTPHKHSAALDCL